MRSGSLARVFRRGDLTDRSPDRIPAQDCINTQVSTPEGLGRFRLLVIRTAGAAGLDSDRTDRLTLAANEVVTNALSHGVPPATVTISTTSAAIAVAVHDRGPGFAPLPGSAGASQDHARRGGPDASSPPPDPGLLSGRGMWLVHHLCDLVDTRTNADGTTVTLTLYR
jgi:anti-sigma regulatory factor (Ser/Thr protein kinase)